MNGVWKELHSHYQIQNWINKPSIFAETAIRYFPKTGKILELGAGYGQDSLYFVKNGFDVLSTDLEITSLAANLNKHEKSLQRKMEILQLDLTEAFPFADQSFDVVYAHLSLHYFDQKTTREIINEIRRVLKFEGVLAFLANSTDDPEYRTGRQLENDFFLVDRITKRYFSVESTKQLTQDFQISLLDNEGQTYKDQAKGVFSLIRFIGSKPQKQPRDHI